MKKFALLTNYSKDKRLVYTRMIKTYITENGGSYWIPRYISEPDKDGDQRYDFSDMPENIECVLVLGGDGTLLQAARELFQRHIPLLGINLGTLGFLTSAEKSELPKCLDSVLDDSCSIDERMMLEGVVYHGSEKIQTNTALNDVIIARAGFSRLVELKIYVNGELLSIYNADGIHLFHADRIYGLQPFRRRSDYFSTDGCNSDHTDLSAFITGKKSCRVR